MSQNLIKIRFANTQNLFSPTPPPEFSWVNDPYSYRGSSKEPAYPRFRRNSKNAKIKHCDISSKISIAHNPTQVKKVHYFLKNFDIKIFKDNAFSKIQHFQFITVKSWSNFSNFKSKLRSKSHKFKFSQQILITKRFVL